MTTMVVNGGPSIDIEAGDQDSVFDVILKAQQEHWGPNASIDTIKINAQPLDIVDEATLKAIPAEDTHIEVTVSEPKQRTKAEIIAEADTYLSRLESGFETVAAKIRMESDPEAYKMLSDGMEGLTTIIELCESLRAADDVPDDLNETFQSFLGELNEKSQELNDAQECEDPTLIADILEYEFVEVVQELRQYLEKFKEYT